MRKDRELTIMMLLEMVMILLMWTSLTGILMTLLVTGAAFPSFLGIKKATFSSTVLSICMGRSTL
eukprot:11505681-Ditylum_brightwellii.AAC.1